MTEPDAITGQDAAQPEISNADLYKAAESGILELRREVDSLTEALADAVKRIVVLEHGGDPTAAARTLDPEGAKEADAAASGQAA